MDQIPNRDRLVFLLIFIVILTWVFVVAIK